MNLNFIKYPAAASHLGNFRKIYVATYFFARSIPIIVRESYKTTHLSPLSYKVLNSESYRNYKQILYIYRL